MEGKHYFLLGLPDSGKTSLIGPLWHVIDSEEVESAYSVTIQPADREYINSLRDKWLKCASPERTTINSIKSIHLILKNKKSNGEYHLTLPDVSGETFTLAFESRNLPEPYVELIKSAEGILLFIHPNSATPPVTINELNKVLGPQAEPQAQQPIDPWTVKYCPPQVVLTDLLQICQSFNTKSLRIAVVISAWDIIRSAVKESNVEPDQWLSENFPLLHQYLASNTDSIQYRTYGISAQGGDYEQDDQKQELLDLDRPSDRIVVQFEDQTSHDITSPFKWLFDDQQ